MNNNCMNIYSYCNRTGEQNNKCFHATNGHNKVEEECNTASACPRIYHVSPVIILCFSWVTVSHRKNSTQSTDRFSNCILGMEIIKNSSGSSLYWNLPQCVYLLNTSSYLRWEVVLWFSFVLVGDEADSFRFLGFLSPSLDEVGWMDGQANKGLSDR